MEPMHRAISVSVDSPTEVVMPIVADLATYPDWLGLVHLAAPIPGEEGVFLVTLRAKIGPLARSKKLRMVRTEYNNHAVRFERDETDGREHSNWVMAVTAESSPKSGTDLEITLSYDGDLWSAPLEVILDSQSGKAGKRLDDYARR
jgi:hypothetical protein